MALGEVKICTLAGPWQMIGASASKQCCSKQCCSLGVAAAIGAMPTAMAAATAATVPATDPPNTIRRPIATSRQAIGVGNVCVGNV
jgi:hypothetical protein